MILFIRVRNILFILCTTTFHSRKYKLALCLCKFNSSNVNILNVNGKNKFLKCTISPYNMPVRLSIDIESRFIFYAVFLKASPNNINSKGKNLKLYN